MIILILNSLIRGCSDAVLRNACVHRVIIYPAGVNGYSRYITLQGRATLRYYRAPVNQFYVLTVVKTIFIINFGTKDNEKRLLLRRVVENKTLLSVMGVSRGISM